MITQTPQACLAFALGPVQDFIATARKGQDLWFGSWLLSELARTAARVAADTPGVTLVLPAPAALNSASAVANKILLRAPSDQVRAVAEAMMRAVQTRLCELYTRTFDDVEHRAPPGSLHRREAEQQLDDAIEMYWASVSEVPGNWGQTRRRAEAALASRKSLRTFAPVTWGAPVPKSRLDGQRESVLDERVFDDLPPELLRRYFGIGASERLCGIALLKRNGHRVLRAADARGARVVSTAHIASWSYRSAWSSEALSGLEQAPRDQLLTELRGHAHRLQDALPADVRSSVPAGQEDPVLGRTDGQVLYPGRLTDLFDPQDPALPSALQALQAFFADVSASFKAAGLDRPAPPSPYYAVIRADGDKMGAWLDGLQTADDHIKASTALSKFALAAEDTATRFHGDCVFAGGDDVLALVPVQTALACAAELRANFLDALSHAPKGDTTPTLSVGVHIAHATDPFRDALAGAAAAEHSAKHEQGRDAFVVRLDKRSGAPVTTGAHWDQHLGFSALQALQTAKAGVLPRGLAYDLRNLADRLDDEREPAAPAEADKSALARIRALELGRVLAQKAVSPEGTTAIWARLSPTTQAQSAVSCADLRRVCNELIITRALTALNEGSE